MVWRNLSPERAHTLLLYKCDRTKNIIMGYSWVDWLFLIGCFSLWGLHIPTCYHGPAAPLPGEKSHSPAHFHAWLWYLFGEWNTSRSDRCYIWAEVVRAIVWLSYDFFPLLWECMPYILSELNQKDKDKHHVISLPCGI